MYVDLLLITLIPIAVTLALYFIDRYTKFKDLSFWTKQIIIGVIFGGIAVFGNEFGVKVNGANANVRDAAPLLAAFFFGGPSGIIAGCIGGVERWLAVYWHTDLSLTRWACSISTILAGFYAAGLRKYLFEKKCPSLGFAFAAGIIMEVFHFTMVFVTNINETVRIIEIIKKLALPMIIAVGVAVAVPCGVVQLLNIKDKDNLVEREKLSNKIKWWLLGSIIFCYLVSASIIYTVQTQSALGVADATFELTISDVEKQVKTEIDDFMEEKLDLVWSRYVNNGYSEETHPAKSSALTSLRTTYNSWCTEFDLLSVDIIKKDEEGRGLLVCSSDLNVKDPGDEGYFYMTLGEEGQSYELHTTMCSDDYSTPGDIFIQEFQPRSDGKDGEIYVKYIATTIDSNYYLAVGISAETYMKFVENICFDTTSNRHINTNGHIFIMDKDGLVISNEEELNSQNKSFGMSLYKLKKSGKQNTTIEGTVYNQRCYYRYTTVESYTIVVVLPYSDVMNDRDSSFMLGIFMLTLSFGILYVMIYSLLKNLVVRKIENVTDSLHKIINGDLNTKVRVVSCLEFKSLSRDINYTVNTLKKYIEDAKKRIDDELAFAKTIQLSALPSTFPAFPDKPQFDLFATMDTAKEVGGDFYDFYITDEDHLAFLIADVSGKGVPAAMFMMEGKAMLKNFAKVLLPADQVLTNSNDGLAQNNEANMFITCWFGILNYKTGHVTFANAGHNYPLIYRKGEGWEYLAQKKNIVLGAMEGIQYNIQEFDMKPGDKIYLYTDGVTEAQDKEGTLYSEPRLKDYLNANKEVSLKETLLGVKEDIDKFANGADQFDDITMVILEYKGDSK